MILLAGLGLGLTMNAESGSEQLLFNFRDQTNSPVWEVVNDDVMGGVSTSQFQIRTNGPAVFSGIVRLENNGGFASVRSTPMELNLTNHTAIALRVRGDGHRYKLTVRTEAGLDSPLYQCTFSTKSGEWSEHRFTFRNFVPTFRGRVLTDAPPLNPTTVTSVGFLISDKQAGPFQLEIDWIKAVP